MQICSRCACLNMRGNTTCQKCGSNLKENIAATKLVPEAIQSASWRDPLRLHRTGNFPDGGALRLQFGGKGESVVLFFDGQQPILLGRHDINTGSLPQLDLTPFAAYQLGVSRRHAHFRQTDDGLGIEVYDLGSSNGTYLNSERLNAYTAYPVNDADELRLGRLHFKIYFQKQPFAMPAKPAPTSEQSQETLF